jgi:hypothetical protein
MYNFSIRFSFYKMLQRTKFKKGSFMANLNISSVNEVIDYIENAYPKWHASIHPDKYYDILIIKNVFKKALKEVYIISINSEFEPHIKWFPSEWCCGHLYVRDVKDIQLILSLLDCPTTSVPWD